MKRIELLLFLLGCALFVGLVWDIGVAELWKQLTSLGWGIIPFLLAEGAAEAIHTVGWRHCLPRTLRSVPLFFLFRVRMAGYAVNYFTPTAAVGGEFTKISLLSSQAPVTEATSGVLIGKVCFAVGHLLFVALGILVMARYVHLSAWQWIPLLVSCLTVTLGILIFFLLQKHGKIGGVVRWVAGKNFGGRPLKKAASIITTVDEELQVFYRERRRDLFLALGWHLIGYSLGIIPTWFFLKSVQPAASAGAAAAVWFLGMCFDLLTFAVPLNAGSLEGSRVLALKFLGYAPRAGMAYGIALRLGQMFWATAGLALRATFGAAELNRAPRVAVTATSKECPREIST